jgi:hypothetical protein
MKTANNNTTNNMKTIELTTLAFNHFKEMYENNRASALARLAANVTYEFSWVGEDLFLASYKADQYARILMIQETNDCTLTEAIEHTIEDLERYISSEYNVRENSSGSLHKEVSTWKFIASMQLLKELKSINK